MTYCVNPSILKCAQNCNFFIYDSIPVKWQRKYISSDLSRNGQIRDLSAKRLLKINMPKLSEEEDKIVAELSCRENIENGSKLLLLARSFFNFEFWTFQTYDYFQQKQNGTTRKMTSAHNRKGCVESFCFES